VQDRDQVWKLLVGPRFDGLRIDQFLARKLPELSRAYIQRLIDEEGAARLDGESVRRSARVYAGQQVEFTVPEVQAYDIEAEDIPLDIVYQDADLLLVHKPVGMVVHPTTHDKSGTLVHALLWHVGDLSGINGVERPGIVHRIDKDTSGLLVVAKNDLAHQGLSDQFRAHSTDRLYVALCWGGAPSPSEGTITTHIGRDPHDRRKMRSVTGTGKEAVTHYRVAERYGPVSMVECALDTGRTHQIRVHLSELGHPLVADPVYGGLKPRWLRSDPSLYPLISGLRGQMLHAATLGFIHPRTDEYVRFACAPPPRMLEVIRGLRSQADLDPDAPGPWEREQIETFGRALA
jgi:23S rRNA pseudouridine1911/1915/1917 synthase